MAANKKTPSGKHAPTVFLQFCKIKLNRHFQSGLIQLRINMFFHIQSLKNIVIYDFVLMNGYHAIANALHQQVLYCIVAHLGCQHTVASSRRTAALHMAQHTGTRLHSISGIRIAVAPTAMPAFSAR